MCTGRVKTAYQPVKEKATMNRFLIGTIAMTLMSLSATAQSIEDLNIQFHGYAAQGFVYTNHNNAFYMDTSDGSAAWTEAVVNISANPTPKLRVGVQGRYWLLGTTGDEISLDWATADYKVNDRFGVRFGKVKTPWGLFNETQDLDPLFLWTLLPQSIYDITTRNSDLAHFGGVAYGVVNLGERIGDLNYRLWGGEAIVPKNDGQFADLSDAGTGPLSAMAYTTLGGALHWDTPIRGLMIGASDGKANQANVQLQGGSEVFAPWNNVSYFGRYEKNKWMVAAEWNRRAATGSLNLTGQPPTRQPGDPRAWYGMASYKVTGKLTAGAYESQMVDHQQLLGPDRYSKDWTVSGRYDCNQYIYIKAEQHFINGTALSFENGNNSALQPTSRLSALRVGVSF